MNIQHFHRDTAVLWNTPVSDGFGRYLFAAPVEIRCHWADSQRRFTDSRTGEEAVSRAEVHSMTEMKPGDMLLRGEISQDSPYQVGAWVIRGTKEARNVRSRSTMWVAFL